MILWAAVKAVIIFTCDQSVPPNKINEDMMDPFAHEGTDHLQKGAFRRDEHEAGLIPIQHVLTCQ